MEHTSSSTEAYQPDTEERIAVLKQIRLGWSRQWYAMAHAFGLKRIQDYFQGASPLLASAGPVWLLGRKYENKASGEAHLDEETMTAILSDFASRLWMTYRGDFPPLGALRLTSDVGWGCTLRSGQMLLAEALLHHLQGRDWRRHMAAPGAKDVSQLLGWFWDQPEPQHPFSIHNLVDAGRKHGIVAGEWLGPWTLCHTLEEVVNRVHPAGLHVHLANSPGGGAPVLYTASVAEIFSEGTEDGERPAQKAVLLLVPLVLGIGKVNPRYVPQLQAVLTWPQSAGIVGGRPSSSLYFVGFQESQVIFLDPHEVQDVKQHASDAVPTHFCNTPRMMPLASIDPSLAIAFYCSSLGSCEDLCLRLSTLEKESGGAPLLNVVNGEPPPPWVDAERTSSTEEGTGKGDEWQLL